MTDKTRQARYMADRRKRGDVTTISVFIPSGMKAEMDDAADAASMTRKDWITAAITEKLDRERHSVRRKKAVVLSLAFLLTGAGVGAMVSRDHRAMPSASISSVADSSARSSDQMSRIIPAADTICRPITVITTSGQNSPSIETAGTRTAGKIEILRRTWSVGCGQDRIISETRIPLPE